MGNISPRQHSGLTHLGEAGARLPMLLTKSRHKKPENLRLHHSGCVVQGSGQHVLDEVGGAWGAALGLRVGAQLCRAAGDLRIGDQVVQGRS